MRVAIAADHAGMALRGVVVEAVQSAGGDPLVLDLPDAGASDDYPDVARMVANAIATGEAGRGVLLCGSGAGVAIAANKFPLVRAASVQDTYTAHQMVEHDDANVLAIGARVIGPETAAELVGAFIRASFSKAPRHSRRLGKILAIEKESYTKRLPLHLRQQGQSIWLHGFDRRMIVQGDLAFLLARLGVSGLLSDFVPVAKAVSAADVYDDLLLHLLNEGIMDVEELSVAVVHSDLLIGAELLEAVFYATSGLDGYVSVLLPTVLTGSSDSGLQSSGIRSFDVSLSRNLHDTASRLNVLLEIPATAEGCVMIEESIAAGRGVNAIMIVCREHYQNVISAYCAGLEYRLQNSLDLGVPLVTSVVVATNDHHNGTEQIDEIYESWHRWLITDRWKSLAAKGAMFPRMAWRILSFKGDTDPSRSPLLDTRLLEHLTVSSGILQVDKDDLKLLFQESDRVSASSLQQTQLSESPSSKSVGHLSGNRAGDMLQHKLLDQATHEWNLLIQAVKSKVSRLR